MTATFVWAIRYESRHDKSTRRYELFDILIRLRYIFDIIFHDKVEFLQLNTTIF